MIATCECGRGRPVPIATRSDGRYGRIKGRPHRFLNGHNTRVRHTARQAAVPPAEVGPTVRRCLACSYPLAPGRDPVLPGWRRSRARGLCATCHGRAAADGSLVDFERAHLSRDDVLDDWALLRSEGYSQAQVAQRLGMTYASLTTALWRARRAGDPRAGQALERATLRGAA